MLAARVCRGERGRRAMMAWLLLTAPVVLSLPGCTCEETTYLGTTEDGVPAVGWRTRGREVVHGVRLEEADGTVVWEISSRGVDPVVLEVGAELEGFETDVPLAGPADLSGRVLRLAYDDGAPGADEAVWSFVGQRHQPSSRRAEVEEQECSLGAMDLHLGRRLGLAAAGLAALSLAVIVPVALHGVTREREREHDS